MRKSICFFVLILGSELSSQSDFTIIGLPDTQYYSENSGTGSIETFIAQTQWIVNNRLDSNIVYIAHLGDCVQNGDDIEQEWINATSAMYLLEDDQTTGLPDGVPYGIAVGNHDQTPWGNPNGTTNFYNQYFGINHFSGKNYYGGHYASNNDNHYDLFEVGSLKFIVVYFEYGGYSNNNLLNWANSLLTTYWDRYAIIVSHRLLANFSGTNVPFASDGTAIYSKLRKNKNLFLMLCGHFTQEGRRTDFRGGDSSDVVTILSDYQGLSNGGNGWLRIMKFSPDNNKINILTYSPTLNSLRTGSNSRFTLNFDFTIPLPVELYYFSGSINGGKVELRWRTETEVNNYGFEVERSEDRVNFQMLGFVQGHGNSNSPKEYFLTDDYPPAGKIYYRLKQIDNDGKFEYSKIVEVEYLVPASIVLSQNYPNPFNPRTMIEYSIPENSFVSLKVYDILGKEIATLVDEEKTAGKYSIEYDGSDLSSGVYIYILKSGNQMLSGKMSLLK